MPDLAQVIMDLINSKPRSPTKAEIEAVLAASFDHPADHGGITIRISHTGLSVAAKRLGVSTMIVRAPVASMCSSMAAKPGRASIG